jgi:hypothetical protein
MISARALCLLPLLAACGAVDTSRGASGFPDAVLTSAEGNVPRGTIDGGFITLNRERPDVFVDTTGQARAARDGRVLPQRQTRRIWD